MSQINGLLILLFSRWRKWRRNHWVKVLFSVHVVVLSHTMAKVHLISMDKTNQIIMGIIRLRNLFKLIEMVMVCLNLDLVIDWVTIVSIVTLKAGSIPIKTINTMDIDKSRIVDFFIIKVSITCSKLVRFFNFLLPPSLTKENVISFVRVLVRINYHCRGCLPD